MPTAPVHDPFALALARLNGARPVRDERLRQVLVVVRAGMLPLAKTQLQDHLKRRPGDADALHLLAGVLVRQGDRAGALAALDGCLVGAPGFAAARYQRAQLRAQAGEHAAALADVDTLLAADAGNPLFRQLQADLLEAVGQAEAALAVCEQLAEAHPARAESWVRLGHARRALGRQADAVAAYRRAIAVRPSLGAAWWGLANLKTLRFGADDVTTMQAQLATPGLGADDRIALQFALAKAEEDAGRAAEAFALYDQGNAALRARVDYDPGALTHAVAANKALFTTDFFAARAGWGHASDAPIFIVGRPRSGSTLVEQILASHPAVEATAELPHVAQLAAQLNGGAAVGPAYDSAHLGRLAALDAAAFRGLGEDYLRRAGAHRHTNRPHFIDKRPANFLHLGLIHLMLPNARIIDVRRHPAASAWSMYRLYSARGGRLRLDELGRYYRDYLALMAHVDKVLPGRVLRVFYEDLVREPEAEVRRLLAHVGLPFEAACLRFHETERAILTPSSEQVRQPLHTHALDQWRAFEPWLGPLLASLGTAYTAYPAVPDELCG